MEKKEKVITIKLSSELFSYYMREAIRISAEEGVVITLSEIVLRTLDDKSTGTFN